MKPTGRWLAAQGVTPNMVTLFGLALQSVVAYFIVTDHLLVAGLIAIGAAFSDAFDGAVAKARGAPNRFGALLDSTVDRISDALYFLPIAWLYAFERGVAWVALASVVALVAAFLVSYVRARAEGLGFECKVGIAERAERLIIGIAALILSPLLPIGVVTLAVLSIITFLQRLRHVSVQAGRGS
jgi:CDP-diacylglycerol--glycerol-3-phosphate 3-phosphatidyltransferase